MKLFFCSLLCCLTLSLCAGNLLCSALDSQDRKIMQEDAPRVLGRIDRKEPLNFYDIKKMSKIGINDDKIIEAIHSTNSVYKLTPADVEELKKSGVSNRVIKIMKKTKP